eukprot:CAMPEP_0173460772 /NCGR_PEP_ID=MMETSP1357-20121228/63744_1 /TAXON_ID=77926 /ORGANISM="Hemiselmis rufescens, Strain PCC563" /LENGTH=73 /DNA_ID=CAMNT_0014428361 /DNA_START=140 /DNA_END=361 /DNA_ORIENTATION=-
MKQSAEVLECELQAVHQNVAVLLDESARISCFGVSARWNRRKTSGESQKLSCPYAQVYEHVQDSEREGWKLSD